MIVGENAGGVVECVAGGMAAVGSVGPVWVRHNFSLDHFYAGCSFLKIEKIASHFKLVKLVKPYIFLS